MLSLFYLFFLKLFPLIPVYCSLNFLFIYFLPINLLHTGASPIHLLKGEGWLFLKPLQHSFRTSLSFLHFQTTEAVVLH